MFFATTGRLNTLAGGCAVAISDVIGLPTTLSRCGATGAVIPATGAEAIACGRTVTAAFDTGCARTKASRDTAVTAPGTLRFTYVVFTTFTFVALMFVTLTWVMLTLRTYSGLA